MRARRSQWPGWIVALFLAGALAVHAVPVREVRVINLGPGPIEEAFVLAHASVKAGDEFDPPTRLVISRDIKALQKTGRFAKVETTVETVPGGIALTYIVATRPVIATLEITGAEYVGNKKIREWLALGRGDPVDDDRLEVAAQKVRDEYYKRYFPDAKVVWKITPAAETGKVAVAVTVKEGRRAFVDWIRFVGNDHVKAKALRKAMKQTQANWLSWITGTGVYNPDDLQSDLDSIRGVLLDNGFLEARVGQPQITRTGRKKLDVLIPIVEGPQYRIGSVQVDGVNLFAPGDVRKDVKLKPGDVASLAAVRTAAEAIRDYYGSRGYIKTVVTDNLDADTNRLTAAVELKVREGTLAYIRNIRIRGNTRTKDKVIRRELAVYPGEVFNEVKVRTSEKRLRNLNYFSYVSSTPESTLQSDQYDLVFDVEEQKTGQFMIGAGFSSVDELIGFVELGQGNFDLFGWPRWTGGGQKIKLRAQVGTKRNDYEITFIEPWFLNRRLSLQVDLFEHDSRYLSDDYDQRNIGGALTLGKALDSFNRINLIYGLEQIDIYNVSTNASDIIQEEKGKRVESSLTPELVHDSRDNAFVPTTGNRSTASFKLAGGPLAGDTDIYEIQGRSSQFWTPWFDHVINLRGWIAVVEEYGRSDRVPIFDRLFLGGPRTLRAFKFRDVGPKDENGEPIGGRSAFYYPAQYTIPIVEKVRGAVFYDAGMVWTEAFHFAPFNLNNGAGLGIRLDFPGFPIQLDYAWPIDTDDYNDRPNGRFSFWIGYVY